MANPTLKPFTSREIIGRYYEKLEGLAKTAWVFLIAHYNPNSDQNSELYTQLDNAPAFKEWLGGRDVKDLDSNELAVVNARYQSAIRDWVDNWRYDKTGQLDARLREFSGRSITHWAKLVTALLQAGTTLTGIDGAAFFGNGHVGSQNNNLTASDNSLLNVAAPTNPTPVEFEAVLGAIIQEMYGFVDEEDEPVNEDAMEFVAVVPVNMMRSGMAATSNLVLSDSGGAQTNTLLTSDFKVTVVPNPRLRASGDDTRLYVFRADGSSKAVVLQERGGVSMTAKAEGSDFEHDTDMWEFGSKAVRGTGLFNWHKAARATLS